MKVWSRVFACVVVISISVEGISQPIIQTDTVIQTSLCAGSNVIIPWTVIDTSGSFNFGNIFTAQLSDPLGAFSNPIDIGSFLIPWTGSGFILGTIPVNTPLLGLYKVRVVGDNPVVIGSESPNFIVIINTAVLAVIQAPDSMICEGDSLELTATPIFNSYVWERNGTVISGATQQTLMTNLAGTYTVTVEDTFACVSTSQPFNVYIETCVGVEELNALGGLNLHPVPSSDFVNIEFNFDRSANIGLRVFDLLGELVLHEEIEVVYGVNDHALDISALPAGVYLIKIGEGALAKTTKLVKQ